MFYFILFTLFYLSVLCNTVLRRLVSVYISLAIDSAVDSPLPPTLNKKRMVSRYQLLNAPKRVTGSAVRPVRGTGRLLRSAMDSPTHHVPQNTLRPNDLLPLTDEPRPTAWTAAYVTGNYACTPCSMNAHRRLFRVSFPTKWNCAEK
jgi:hypothetical protein